MIFGKGKDEVGDGFTLVINHRISERRGGSRLLICKKVVKEIRENTKDAIYEAIIGLVLKKVVGVKQMA